MLIVFKRKAMTNEKFAESEPPNVIEYSESSYRLFSIFSGVPLENPILGPCPALVVS
jgi:hypothetical protein